MNPVLKSVDRILLRVPNVEAAARFYVETLGLRLDRRHGSAAALKFESGDTELVLHDDRQRPDLEIVLGVDDVGHIYENRESLGITFLTAPAPGRSGNHASIRDPFGNVLTIADRGSKSGPAVPDGRLFADNAPPEAVSDRAALIAAYTSLGRTADDLPYTPHFEELYSTYTRPLEGAKPSRNEVWLLLLTLRKSKKLPKLGPATSKPPAIEATDKQRLRDLLGADIGKRDRLPYTERFDEIVAKFNDGFARAWSPHIVWRLVATLAK